jgi:proline racemase
MRARCCGWRCCTNAPWAAVKHCDWGPTCARAAQQLRATAHTRGSKIQNSPCGPQHAAAAVWRGSRHAYGTHACDAQLNPQFKFTHTSHANFPHSSLTGLR